MSPHLLAEHLIDGSFRRLKGPDHSIVLSFSISCRLSLSHCFPPRSHVIAHSVRSSLAFWSSQTLPPFLALHILFSLCLILLFLVPATSIIHIFAWTFWLESYQQELSGSSCYTCDIRCPTWGCMHTHTHTVKHKWTIVHTFSDAREGSQVLKSRFWSHECSKKDNQKQWW